MMAGILVPVVFVAGSLVIDTTNALSMKTHLQNAADSAALATTTQLAEGTITEAQAKDYATVFFNGQVADATRNFDAFTVVPTVNVSHTGTGKKTVWNVEVAAVGSQNSSALARIAGKNSLDVTISATSQSARDASNPISMMLVLDRSGSMGWASGQTTTQVQPKYCTRWVWSWSKYSWQQETYQCGTETVTTDIPKIAVLKDAVGKLVNHIVEADPDDAYARIGAVAYNNQTNHGDKFNITWDKPKVTEFANGFSANGGTYSVDAMKWAYEQVTGVGEVNAHFSKNGSKDPSKFIVFMTDGKNETGSTSGDAYADKMTKQHCQSAKDAGTTIFAVAFQAPPEGQSLLKACASGNSFYYDAQSADELTKAFEAIGEEAVKLTTRLTN
ncbi:pilus assembly protein TadG-related protein [Hoeflea sp.]|uniref:pilus assembly protein TadG-related protein n=1 Tax=Hoeflea sp. TaxID=1940281 RepID=UPI003BAF01E1